MIGGANLMGGYGTRLRRVHRLGLLEVIRNALLMAGVDSNWQGAFVGVFIILAVLLGMQTAASRCGDAARSGGRKAQLEIRRRGPTGAMTKQGGMT